MAKVNPKSFQGLMKRLRNSRAYPYATNRYVLAALSFLVWMLVFDDNSVLQQAKRRYTIYEQNNKIQYYRAEIHTVNEEREALFGNPEALERFARERYKMIGEGEDLYLVMER